MVQGADTIDLPRTPRAPVAAVVRVKPVTPPKPKRTYASVPKLRTYVKPVLRTHAPSASKVSTLISFLRAQVGKPYVYGGNGPYSYDCSGLVVAAFKIVGIQMPRIAADQATVGVPVSLSSLQPGDLLFWGSPAGHTAIYIGAGQFIAAENSRLGVVIEPMTFDEPQYARRVL